MSSGRAVRGGAFWGALKLHDDVVLFDEVHGAPERDVEHLTGDRIDEREREPDLGVAHLPGRLVVVLREELLALVGKERRVAIIIKVNWEISLGLRLGVPVRIKHLQHLREWRVAVVLSRLVEQLRAAWIAIPKA